METGFKLHCLYCGEEDSIMLCLDDCKSFRCSNCDRHFDLASVKSWMSEWNRAIEWVLTAPARQPEGKVKR